MTVHVLRTPREKPLPGDFARLDDAALALQRSDLPLLSAIFPWGTEELFNRLQVPELLVSLQSARRGLSGEVDDEIGALIAFLRDRIPEGETDYYVWCSAD